MKRIPKALEKYFWDVNPKTIDCSKHERYIIERILELGNEQAVLWMQAHYARRAIMAALSSSRKISKRSANFWELRLGIKK